MSHCIVRARLNSIQTVVSNPEGRYRLLRTGDAVESRNIHAAILDARRVV